MGKTTSLSRSPPIPIAPGSLPPCPGSIITTDLVFRAGVGVGWRVGWGGEVAVGSCPWVGSGRGDKATGGETTVPRREPCNCREKSWLLT